ncbi:MAG: hypothetical protein E7591_07705 [Ruminococcaceae bacterium]|nr:hypothetical protein [Oscillospiraceae bacterium]
MAKGDYISAIRLLEDESDESQDVMDAYKKACDNYTNIQLEKANRHAAFGDYDKAIEEAESINIVVGERVEVTNALIIYYDEQNEEDTSVVKQTDIEYTSHEAFYGIWLYASKNLKDAEQFASANNAKVFVTTDCRKTRSDV